LIVQVASTVFPAFELPSWALRGVIVLLAIGFIPALVISWVFELTPEGLKREDEIEPDASITPHTAQRMDRMLWVGALLALSYFAVDKFLLAPHRAAVVAMAEQAPPAPPVQAASASANSIAVLAFENLSTDAENGFFADGISEELLNVLAGVKGLTVASRTSAFSFKGKNTPIPDIARQLGVQHVLEGSVRKQGQRVRISAQLINADSDKHVWSASYDRDLADIFKVQEEIAQAIAHSLAGVLGERQVTVAASTQNLDAYQNFLRGRARFQQRSELLAAIADLTQATEQDPNFGQAWIYLAAAWLTAPGYYSEADLGVANAMVQAGGALQKAEALLPQHPMLLATQGNLLDRSGDLAGGLALLQKSAKLSTQDSTPTLWFGLLLLRAGYVAEATTTLEKAQAMDPLAGVCRSRVAGAPSARAGLGRGDVLGDLRPRRA
jgi:adenylate cyclase